MHLMKNRSKKILNGFFIKTYLDFNSKVDPSIKNVKIRCQLPLRQPCLDNPNQLLLHQ